ncbi:MAG: twin-arginine translocase subunit TatC [Bryobacteraceae bacterium]|nr:twin-arginine translocase subunit TatC [Bryobacteraceae bacterium]
MSQEPDKQGAPGEPHGGPGGVAPSGETTEVSYSQTTDDPYGYSDDPYAYESNTAPVPQEQAGNPPAPPAPPADPPPPEEEETDPDEEGMLRMSFLDHLEELRTRIIRALMGMGVAFLSALIFANQLWQIVSDPAIDALKQLGVDPPKLVQITPMEAFSTIWVKVPMLTSIFLASPWILYQVWAFIAPGLYKKERRMAGPFVLCSAGLFILGGLFAYFVAFRYGLVFLLGIGRDINVQPMVSITEYFELFVNVTLGVGLVFETPILIFFLTLLRIASPKFLLENSRYAILIIVVLAAIITPTPDVFNLMIFSVPMILLFFVGVFASHLLVLSREGRRFPWDKVLYAFFALMVIGSVWAYFAVTRFGFKVVPYFPFLAR